MRNAQTEEFKHFAMDLEFLLRRTPMWREIARGDPVPARATSSRRARRPRRAPASADRVAAAAGLAGHRELEGDWPVNHLLRDVAPITEQGWDELDRRPDAARAGARGPQGRGLRRPARLDYSATNLGRIEPLDAGEGVRPRAARAAAGRAARRLRAVALRARRPRARRRGHRPRAAREAARRIAARREHRRLPRLAPRPASAASPRPARTTRSRFGDDFNAYASHTAEAVETLLRNGIRGPVRARARPRPVHRRHPDRRARRLPALRPPQEDPRRRPDRLGPGRRTARSSSPYAAATSSSSPARTSRSATPTTTPISSTSTSRRPSPSGSPPPRPPAPFSPLGPERLGERAEGVFDYLEESFSVRVATEAASALQPGT